jgi:hypothetical protein
VTHERIGAIVLRAYPPAIRLARGPEMLSMLLDAGDQSRLAFTRECGSLLMGGLRERAHAHRRRILLVTPGMLIAILALGALAIGLKTSRAAQNKSMRSLAGAVAPRLRHGDLVLVAAPEQTPVAYKYLPDGLRYATPLGFDGHPGVAYHHIYSSLARSSPQAVLDRVLTTLAPGQHLLFIRPLTAAQRGWASRRSVLVRLRAAQLGAVLAQDPKLRVVGFAPHNYKGPCCVTESAQLYVET